MDTYGFVILGAGLLVYYLVKDKRWGCLLSGVGLGIVIGAVGAVLIVRNMLP